MGVIKEQGRSRANTDPTFQKISQRDFGLPQQNLTNESPRVSDGFMIKEDYFTAQKNRLYYRMSTKNSGHSYSSEQSNVSSVKGFSPFIPQVNLPTQGSSTLLKSCLEGGTLGTYDSHENGSNKAKMDYLRQLNNSRNRDISLSFDENIRNNPNQRSFSSLFNQNNAQPGGQ